MIISISSDICCMTDCVDCHIMPSFVRFASYIILPNFVSLIKGRRYIRIFFKLILLCLSENKYCCAI